MCRHTTSRTAQNITSDDFLDHYRKKN
jgi:hypothetical protein